MPQIDTRNEGVPGSDEGRLDGTEFAAAARYEAQALRYRAHEKLMRAFLIPRSSMAVFES